MTCNSPFSPAIHLSPCDITFLPNSLSPQHMSVRIKVSKTDPFRSGHTFIIGKTAQPICPVRAMQVFLSFRGPHLVHFSSICLVLLSLKRVLHLKLGSFSPRLVCSPLNMRDIATGLGLLQPLPLSASPVGLSKLWGGGPLIATKDIFNVPILSFLGSRISC